MNQKHVQIIQDFINPLEKFYSRSLTEAQIKIYCERLERFNPDVLSCGVGDVIDTWERTTFPTLPFCLNALQRKSTTDKNPQIAEAVQRLSRPEREATELYKAYTDKLYKNSPQIVFEARNEGWFFELRDLICNGAWMQAQRIANLPNKYWMDKEIVKHTGQTEREYLDAMAAQAQTGIILVSIPKVFIEWARGACCQANRQSITTKPTRPHQPVFIGANHMTEPSESKTAITPEWVQMVTETLEEHRRHINKLIGDVEANRREISRLKALQEGE
jgi:hypothetical protein